jgi:hypothetical protein
MAYFFALYPFLTKGKPLPLHLQFKILKKSNKDVIRHLPVGTLADDVPIWVAGPRVLSDKCHKRGHHQGENHPVNLSYAEITRYLQDVEPLPYSNYSSGIQGSEWTHTML